MFWAPEAFHIKSHGNCCLLLLFQVYGMFTMNNGPCGGEKFIVVFFEEKYYLLSVKVMLWELFLFNLFIWRTESETEKDPILGLLPKYPCQLGLGPSSSWRLDVTSVYLSRSYIIVIHKTQRILNIPDYTSGSMVHVFTQALYFSFLTVN